MLIVLPNELDVLRDVQPLDRDVFNYLAERVDYDTGVVGAARRVSYGGMAYDLTERDGERRRPESLRKVSSKQVENSLTRLVKLGLFARLSRGGFNQSLALKRVFWAELLLLDTHAKKPDGSQLVAVMGVVGKIQALVNKALRELSTDGVGVCPPTSWDNIFTHQHQQQGGENPSYPQAHVLDAERFPMSLDWQATEEDFKSVLQRAGFADADVKPAWIAEFVAYWYAEGQRRYTQREWTARLALRVVDYLANPGQFDRLRGLDDGIAPPPRSMSGRPDWARIPRRDEDLPGWAMRNGYGQAAIGMTFNQYRAALRDKVERRLRQ